MGSRHEKTVIIISVIVLALIAAAILFGTGVIRFGSFEAPKKETGADSEPGSDTGSTVIPSSSTDDPAPEPQKPGSYTCIVRDIDLDSCIIGLYDIDSGADLEFTFTAATDIKTSYGKVIGAALLKVGDIVAAETGDGSRLDSIKGSDGFKTHKDVMRFTIDPAIERITAGSNVYKYDDRLLVLDGERFIDIGALNPLDVISLFYRDNTIFFIKVVSSHGFLSFTGTDDFDGGSISLGGNQTGYQVSEGLSIPLAVGDYNVYVENLELSASADIRIESHKTAVFDLSPFGRVPVSYGDVTFNITPEGALLYIDGINTLYSGPVSIPEGSHSIRVELGGYIAFVGTIDVSPSGGTFNISLPPAPAKSDDTPPDDILYNESEEADSYLDDSGEDTETYTDDGFIFDDSTSDTSLPDAEGDGDETGTSSGTDVTPSSSSGLKLMISCTEGTDVYVNGTHVSTVTGGTAISAKPDPGTVTVRLTLDGYISRTYTVTIEDDGEDAVFSFPAMVKQ